MHFETLSDFFAMGGYAAYVWGAFGITFGALLVLTIVSIGQGKTLIKQVRDKQARQARIKAAQQMENTL